MTYEEKKKVINAAKVLKEYCIGISCGECIFREDRSCLIDDNPDDWEIPKLTRWTPEDIALAKALKAFGAITIKRWANGYITWEDKDGRNGYIPPISFKNLQKSNEISINTIIKEVEE